MQVLPKASSELWPSIRDNSARYPMKSDYLIEVQLSIVSWTEVCTNRNEVCRLGQTVYNHPNRVKIPLSMTTLVDVSISTP